MRRTEVSASFAATEASPHVAHVRSLKGEGGFAGGPLAIVQDGDGITIDAEGATLSLNVDEAEIAKRFADWKRPAPRYTRGVLAKYAKLVSSASEGAVTDKGLGDL